MKLSDEFQTSGIRRALWYVCDDTLADFLNSSFSFVFSSRSLEVFGFLKKKEEEEKNEMNLERVYIYIVYCSNEYASFIYEIETLWSIEVMRNNYSKDRNRGINNYKNEKSN